MIKELFKSAEQHSFAIIQGTQKITYLNFESQVMFYMNQLTKAGVSQGDKVALELEDKLEFFVILVSLFTLGAKVLPLSANYNECYKCTLLDIFNPDKVINNVGEFEEYIPEKKTNSFIYKDSSNNAQVITFTSGTTGTPKAVCHDLKSLLVCAEAFNKHNEIGCEVKMLHVMPCFYMAGILNTFLCPLIAGGCVILSTTFSASNAATIFKNFAKYRANAIWLSPSMLALSSKMTTDRDTIGWVSDCAAKIFIGTAPLMQNTKKEFEHKFAHEVLESYGTSEQLFISCAKVGEGHLDGVGRCLDLVNVTFSDSNEILIDSPWEMLGYLNADSECPATGDIGKSSSGVLSITGRKKDIIIKGGINISSRYIEDVSLKYAGIMDAAVVAKPHDFWGEVPILFLLSEHDLNIKSIKAWLGTLLPSEFLPEKIIVLKSFPTSVTGKVMKAKLIEKYLV